VQVTSFLLPPLPFPLWCSPGQGDISFPQKDHPVVLEKVRELRAMRQSDIHRWHHSKQITHSIPTHNPRMSEDAENWNSNFAINSLLKIIEYNTQLTKDWVTCSYRSCPLPPRARDPFTVYVPKTRTWEFKTEVFSLILEVFKTRLDGALGNLTQCLIWNHRTIEYSRLEGTYKDHWVQLNGWQPCPGQRDWNYIIFWGPFQPRPFCDFIILMKVDWARSTEQDRHHLYEKCTQLESEPKGLSKPNHVDLSILQKIPENTQDVTLPMTCHQLRIIYGIFYEGLIKNSTGRKTQRGEEPNATRCQTQADLNS